MKKIKDEKKKMNLKMIKVMVMMEGGKDEEKQGGKGRYSKRDGER